LQVRAGKGVRLLLPRSLLGASRGRETGGAMRRLQRAGHPGSTDRGNLDRRTRERARRLQATPTDGGMSWGLSARSQCPMR